jgi:calcineurin-like phosphoesterase family protein
MNNALIDDWYSKVREDDTVIVAGDFWWNPRGANPIYEDYFDIDMGYQASLPGYKILVKGSHDNKADLWFFDEVHSMYTLYVDQGKKYPMPVIISHCAMRVWEQAHYGSMHCYGHSHGRLPGYGRSMDIGVDTNNFEMYRLEDVVEKLMAIDYTLTHGIKE